MWRKARRGGNAQLGGGQRKDTYGGAKGAASDSSPASLHILYNRMYRIHKNRCSMYIKLYMWFLKGCSLEYYSHSW